jgi:hypothetical protein
MKKLNILLSILLLTQMSLAQNIDDRLMELLQKKADLQLVGKDLDTKDSDEFSKLASTKGIVGTAELQQQIKQKNSQVTDTKTVLPPVSAQHPPGGATAEEKSAQEQAYQNHLTKTVVPGQAEKNMLKLRDQGLKRDSVKAEQKPMNPNSVSSTDFVEEKSLGASSVQGSKPSSPVVTKLPKKKEMSEPEEPNYTKRLKKEMTTVSEIRKNIDDAKAAMAPVIVETKTSAESKSGAIYDPVPNEPGVKQNGFVVDRDSQTIITKRVGTKDAITIKMCIAYGVSIILDESIDTELQRILLDDKIFFDAQDFDNKRGVFVRLKKPIPDGSRWESAIRLVRKSDDRTYLVNLVGVGCPEGNIDFPKVVYLKEKFDVLSARQSEVMAPEDKIIEVSQGLPRKNLHEVKVYDMVASPGSDWVVFGVEIQKATISKPDKIEFAALDNLQINKLNVKAEYMKLQSDKSTELRGESTYRFKIMMAIDKSYIFKNRFVHLVYLNKETKHYQYIQIDTLQYFKSLKERGFDL